MEEEKVSTKIKKNQTADIPTKNGSKYSYKYVDIAQIHDFLESINARYIQQIKRIDNDDYVMTKRCFDNKWEEEWLQGCKVVDATLFGVSNPAQEQGSALTYARRYSLLMAFGLATEDDDAQSLSKPKEEKEPTQEDADNYKFTFGKNKGKTLKEVEEEDPKYIDWLLNNSNDEYMLKLIPMATGIQIVSKEEINEKTKKIIELNSLLDTTNTDREDFYVYYNVRTNNDMSMEQLDDAISKLRKKLIKNENK